jgi:O-antigen/teichoic acid export membrane protein
VHQAKLERALRFRELSLCHLFGFAVPYAAVAIVAALLGAGVWSPVLGGLAGIVGQGLMLMRCYRWRPKGGLEWSSLRGLLGFGMGITGASVVAFGLDNLDYFVVGKELGAAQLGLYTIAFQITAMPRSKVSSAVLKVAFPTFAQIQEDKALLNTSYIALNRYVAFVTFPMMAGLMVVPEAFVVALLGEKWAPSAPALTVLCLAGALMSIRSTVGTVLNAVGRADLGFYSNLAVFLVAIPVVLLMAPMGIVAAGWAMVIVSVVNFFPLQFVLSHLTGLSVAGLLRALVAPLAISVVMALVVLAATFSLDGAWTKLLVGVPLGVLFYTVAVRLCCPDVTRELRGVLARRGGAQSSG